MRARTHTRAAHRDHANRAQELARYEIDVRNIVINQLIFPEAAAGSRLLEARVRMQQKYLQQFHDLYEDFHLVKMPLLEEEVRGVEALKAFSANLMRPYQPPAAAGGGGSVSSSSREAALEAEVAALKQRVAQLEAQLAAAQGK
jgi:arsenite-transporting ATPase